MGEIVKSLSDEHYLYCFSSDILMLVRTNARLVGETDDDGLVFHLNLSSIFLAGSFLEARLNEQIAMCAHRAPQDIKPTQQFWLTLSGMQKNISVVDKWNLISSARNGQQWDGAKEPFQSHDTLSALRNELVHFKGRFTQDDAPPINRLKSLMRQFKSTRHWKLKAMEVDPWLVSLVGSKELGLWIDSTVFALHSQFEELLIGAILTPDQKIVRDMLLSNYGAPPKFKEKKKRNKK